MNAPAPRTNRLALLSLILSILTVISFCIGLAPIPLTAPVCYPGACLLGLGAMFAGLRALTQLRHSQERGGVLAWLGLGVGGASILAVIFFSALGLALLFFGADYVQQFWQQMRP